MKNLKKLLFAAVLIGAAVVSTPKTVQADPVGCGVCASSGGTNCQACCMCDGNTAGYCVRACS
ncbi:MAG: hypothetical protein JF614_13790 [Acidobacteria bacterium]|nr:hypothetical protein [Acidobacteriota bacterium]